MSGEDTSYNAEDSDLDSHTGNDDTDFNSGYVVEESDSCHSSSGETIFGGLVRENDSDTELSIGWLEGSSTISMTTDNDISELDLFIDDVTDDKNDAGPEETGAIVWRHIKFHIIRSILAGRPNILLDKFTFEDAPAARLKYSFAIPSALIPLCRPTFPRDVRNPQLYPSPQKAGVALFKGLGPSLTGVVPDTVIKFYTYGNCKLLLPGVLQCSK
ncbi:hypothetical protein GX48_07010 [Paracoccidioides brasiliensis]|nr:hypothetical protein GX48_07010 [Paracoccidioides brasiliensis]